MNKLNELKKRIKDKFGYDDETVEIQLTNFIFAVNHYYDVDLREPIVSEEDDYDVDYKVLWFKVKCFTYDFIRENFDLLMDVSFDPITVMMYNSLNRVMDSYEAEIKTMKKGKGNE